MFKRIRQLVAGKIVFFLTAASLSGCFGSPSGGGFAPPNPAIENPSNNPPGGNLATPSANAEDSDIPGEAIPMSAALPNTLYSNASPDGTLNPKGDDSHLGRGLYYQFKLKKYGTSTTPMVGYEPKQNPPPLIASSNGLDLELLVREGIGRDNISYNWSNELVLVDGSGIQFRVIFAPEGKAVSDYKYQDVTVYDAEPKSEGYNVYFPDLHLGNGELDVYVMISNNPSKPSENHLVPFSDEDAYHDYINDEFVKHLAKFKISTSGKL